MARRGDVERGAKSSPATGTFRRRDDLRGLVAVVAFAGSLVTGGGIGYRGLSTLADEVHAMRGELAQVSQDVAKGDVKRDEIRTIVDDLSKRLRELELDAARRRQQ